MLVSLLVMLMSHELQVLYRGFDAKFLRFYCFLALIILRLVLAFTIYSLISY